MMDSMPKSVATESSDTHLRVQLLDVSKKLVELGLNQGTSGNCSVRSGEHFLITPSGIPVEKMSIESLVKMGFTGQVIGQGKPSSEWRFHHDILAAREDVNAVIHVHSMFATTLACLNKSIPAFHYMISAAGGDSIRCAPYAIFGSQELSDNAITALLERKACLLANHGMIVLGSTLENALAITAEVEILCEQYCHTLTIGEPDILSTEQMQEVLKQFKNYGNWNQDHLISTLNNKK